MKRKTHLLQKPTAHIDILYRSPLKLSKICGRRGSVGKPSDGSHPSSIRNLLIFPKLTKISCFEITGKVLYPVAG